MRKNRQLSDKVQPDKFQVETRSNLCFIKEC